MLEQEDKDIFVRQTNPRCWCCYRRDFGSCMICEKRRWDKSRQGCCCLGITSWKNFTIRQCEIVSNSLIKLVIDCSLECKFKGVQVWLESLDKIFKYFWKFIVLLVKREIISSSRDWAKFVAMVQQRRRLGLRHPRQRGHTTDRVWKHFLDDPYRSRWTAII